MSPRTMKRFALVLSLLASVVAAHDGMAQTAARRPVQVGDVTGVDLQIEGALAAPRGGTLRLPVAAVEVVGLRDLRPAGRANVRVLSSLAREREAAELVLDARGRGVIELPVPEDAPSSFFLVIELRHRGSILRRFDLAVQTTEPRRLDAQLAPRRVFPGSELELLGRATLSPSGRAAADVELEAICSDASGPIGRPMRLRTDSAGLYAQRIPLPRATRTGTISCRVSWLGDVRHPFATTTTAELVAREAPALLVSVAPSKVIVRSEETIDLTVLVRRPDGRPVPRATAFIPGLPERETVRVTTDERGLAHLSRRLGAIGDGYTDVTIGVQVTKAGLGTGNGYARVRLAAEDFAGTISVEGGSFVGPLEGRVFVRAVTIDGRRAPAGTPVRLSGPRLPTPLVARTDEHGVAVFDVRLGAMAEEGDDPCGGRVATSLEATLGDGQGAAETRLCAPIDADGLVRVRLGRVRVRAGATLPVHVDRAPAAARLPVVVTLLSAAPQTHPVRSIVLEPSASDAELPIPDDVVGHVVVRARALHATEWVELRGGTAMAEVVSGSRVATSARLDVETGRVGLSIAGEPPQGARTLALALPIDELRLITGELDPSTRIAVPRPESLPGEDLPESLLAAALAAETPLDTAAPFVLVEGRITSVPAPADPVAAGLLRDPWRARARFVEGRLALLFRAIEDFVDQAVPGRLEDVAAVSGGRHRFNAAILASVAREGMLGAEGATGLGGEPLAIEQLARLDPAFTYDAVARRITRRRLFLLLLELRAYVAERGLDLPWARPGEPAQWLRDLPENGTDTYGGVTAHALVDAWGNPFALRPTSRPRFSLLVPVPGYELVSAGPDGRLGTGDDLWDPTARVLPERSLYAEAVGEDALVARLRGVELGRATIASVRSAFEVGGVYVNAPEEGLAVPDVYGRSSLPPRIELDPEALSIRRIGETVPSHRVGPMDLASASGGFAIPFDREPRTWGVLVLTATPEGAVSVATSTGAVGSPFLVNARLPERLRVGETLEVDVPITNVGSADRSARAVVSGEGCATVSSAGELGAPAGRTTILRLSLGGRCAGSGRLVLRLLDPGGAELASLEHPLAVDAGLHPERRRESALVGRDGRTIEVAPPEGSEGAVGRLVLVAPSAAAEIPELAEVRIKDPALVAWARAMAGGTIDPPLRAAVLRSIGEGPELPTASLSRAAAIVALSTLVDDPEAAAVRDRLLAQLGASPAPFEDEEPRAAATRMRAALVAALLASGGSDENAPPSDVVGSFVVSSLPQLRISLRDLPEEPTLLAVSAASLLLASPTDAHGRAMLERASSARAPNGRGTFLVRGAEGRSRSDAIAATFALAVAAHQVGDEDLARAAIGGAMRELAVVGRIGGEAAFWYLAASAYGVLGGSDEPSARVRIDGRLREAAFENGRAVVPFDVRPGRSTEVRIEPTGSGSLVAVVETAYATPFRASGEGPLTLAIQGDPGHESGVAALELSVTASEKVVDGVIDLFLPSGVVVDEVLLGSLRRSGYVRSVEARTQGSVRLLLRPIAAGTTVAIPLPLEMRAHGTMRGFGASAYAASDPYRRTVRAEDAIEVLPPEGD